MMKQHKIISILRNPYGFTSEQIKQVQLAACDEIELLQDAYTNMRDFAEENGLNTIARDSSQFFEEARK